MKEAQSL